METTERNNSPPTEARPDKNIRPAQAQDTAAITLPTGENSGPREPNELENGLASEAAHLDDEQTEALIFLLRELREQGLPLNEATVAGCVGGAKQAIALVEVWAKKDEALREERRHRDSLPEPERIEYMVKRLRDHLVCTAVFQRPIMQRLLREKVSPAHVKRFGNHLDDVVEGVRKNVFEGTTAEFQEKICRRYVENVLPGIEAEEMARDAEQVAIDELLNDGLDGMNAGQIRALTKGLLSTDAPKGQSQKPKDTEPDWGRITWLVDWMRSRSIETKIAALYMQNLIRCGCCLPGETAGDVLYHEFKADVFDGEVPPELRMQAGFLLGLHYMEV